MAAVAGRTTTVGLESALMMAAATGEVPAAAASVTVLGFSVVAQVVSVAVITARL